VRARHSSLPLPWHKFALNVPSISISTVSFFVVVFYHQIISLNIVDSLTFYGTIYL
jgi:hypothetical protein